MGRRRDYQETMNIAYIGLGSNVGDRVANIEQAVELLAADKSVRVTRRSSLYETKPVGYRNQPDFINAVIEVETSLTPQELIGLTKSIEEKLQRQRLIIWGPRTIDMDILFYNDQSINEPHLQVPHPEIEKRAFVLVPLAEIAGNRRHPSGKTINEMLKSLGKVKDVKLYSSF